MALRHVNPKGLFVLDGYSQVVVAEDQATVYIGGQTAYDENFSLVGEGDYLKQMIKALNNIKVAIEAVGGVPENIASSIVYIKNLTEESAATFFKAMSVALDGEPFPKHAFSLIGVHSLSGDRTLVEISAIAVLSKRKS